MRFLEPTWPAPKHVKAYTTTRQDGYSIPPYASFNIALHVNDDPNLVQRNRSLLAESLGLPSQPIWLQQVHGNDVIVLEADKTYDNPIADAAVTTTLNAVCVIMTADCLPVLICDQAGTTVSAIHAGWKGLASGIIEKTLEKISQPRSTLIAWLGPAIGPTAFEVSEDVLQVFSQRDSKALEAFSIKPGHSDKWLANIYLLAKHRLNDSGIKAIYGGEFCTYHNQDKFYSYRRDKGITGRMATLIWLGT